MFHDPLILKFGKDVANLIWSMVHQLKTADMHQEIKARRVFEFFGELYNFRYHMMKYGGGAFISKWDSTQLRVPRVRLPANYWHQAFA